MPRGSELEREPLLRDILEGVPRGASRLVRQFLELPLEPPVELRERVRGYLAKLQALDGEHEFLDLQLARCLAARCEALVTGLGPSASQVSHAMVQAAVLYFVEDEDSEGDTASPIGFDDDAEVIEAIARKLGRDDVLNISEENS